MGQVTGHTRTAILCCILRMRTARSQNGVIRLVLLLESLYLPLSLAGRDGRSLDIRALPERQGRRLVKKISLRLLPVRRYRV